ncbi:MAG: Hsp20/alpha crystallin family protein [Christensenellales bacterium]
MLTLVPYRRYLGNTAMNRNSIFDDQFFKSFFNMSDAMGATGFRVDIQEKGDNYLMSAELPGVSMDKINLSINDDVLVVGADFDSKVENERGSYYYSERRTGHVERSFNLEGIDPDRITASYDNGILTVTLPKTQPAGEKTPRKIAINAANLEASKQDSDVK